MTWLALAPQLDQDDDLGFYVSRGLASDWSSKEDFRTFDDRLGCMPVMPRYLPFFRNPDNVNEPIPKPIAFRLSNRKLLNAEEVNDADIPDIIWGPAHSWIVNERAQNVLESLAPSALRFERVPLIKKLACHWTELGS